MGTLRCNRCIPASPPVTDLTTARQAAGSAYGCPPAGDVPDHPFADGTAHRPKDSPMASPCYVSLVVTFFQGVRSADGGATGQSPGSTADFTPRGMWRSYGKSARGPLGRAVALLVASLIAAPALASTLLEGSYVRVGGSCEAPASGDRLISNGQSVSPPGQNCRVVSRTSTGSYYPVFNQRCTSSAEEYRLDVRVTSPDRIRVTRSGRPAVAYRHCRSQGTAFQRR
jgi:hypothetical protein